MTRWLWRKRLEQADEAVRVAEHLRDRAQAQQSYVETFAPRVDALLDRFRSSPVPPTGRVP